MMSQVYSFLSTCSVHGSKMYLIDSHRRISKAFTKLNLPKFMTVVSNNEFLETFPLWPHFYLNIHKLTQWICNISYDPSWLENPPWKLMRISFKKKCPSKKETALPFGLNVLPHNPTSSGRVSPSDLQQRAPSQWVVAHAGRLESDRRFIQAKSLGNEIMEEDSLGVVPYKDGKEIYMNMSMCKKYIFCGWYITSILSVRVPNLLLQ